MVRGWGGRGVGLSPVFQEEREVHTEEKVCPRGTPRTR